MAINFPNPATLNQTYTVGLKTWVYNGYAWDLVVANTAPILNTAISAFNQANSAYTAANTGISVGQNAFGIANAAYTQANTGVTNAATALGVAQSSFAAANNEPIAKSAFTQANTGVTNAATALGVAQNAFGIANASYTQANTGVTNAAIALGVGQNAFTQANTATTNAATALGVGQNAFGIANASYTQANTGVTNAATALGVGQNAFTQANTGVTNAATAFGVGQNAFGIANAAYTQANTGVTNAATALSVGQAAFARANVETIAQTAFTQANSAYSTANTKFSSSGGTISGAVTINNDLTVTGNIYLNGNTITLSSNNLTIDDSLIYLANNNPANVNDIGIVGHFTATPTGYQHTGFVRDASDGVWKLFSNVVAEFSNNTIDFSSAVYDTLKVGTVIGNNYGNSNTATTLQNSRLINGTSFDGSASITISANTFNALTFGNGFNVGSFNGSSATTLTANNASTTLAGIVQLTDSVSSTSTTTAATPNSIKLAYDQATNAFNRANVETIAQTAFTQANTALGVGQNAFTQANTGVTNAATALGVAQNAFTQANTGVTNAATALGVAQNAYNQANTATGISQSAFGIANAAYNRANTATLAVNISGGSANQIVYQTSTSNTSFITAPSVTNSYLKYTTGNGFNWTTLSVSLPWVYANSNTTALVGSQIIANTLGGSFTVTLPANPTLGDTVSIIDGGNWKTNNLFVGRNGSTIEGYSEDLALDIGQSSLNMIYDGSTWQMVSTVGPKGDPQDISGIYSTANTAIAIAQGSYATANTKFSANGGIINGSVTVSQDLRVNGALSIGAAPSAGLNFINGTSITGAADSYANISNGTIQSDVTNQAFGYRTSLSTQATAFTLASLNHFRATQSTIGLGSIVTNQYGFVADSTLTGATNNYGFYGNIASGTGRYNLYMAGTADNYMAGNVLVGTTSNANTSKVVVAGTIESTSGGFRCPDGSVLLSAQTLILDDISNQFDGYKSVFNLTANQAAINTIVDSKDLDVFINGYKLSPYVTQVTYPWLTPYDSFRGFRVKSGQLIIYNPPYIGESVSLTIRNISSTVQTRQYPYSATTIALGD